VVSRDAACADALSKFANINATSAFIRSNTDKAPWTSARFDLVSARLGRSSRERTRAHSSMSRRARAVSSPPWAREVSSCLLVKSAGWVQTLRWRFAGGPLSAIPTQRASALKLNGRQTGVAGGRRAKRGALATASLNASRLKPARAPLFATSRTDGEGVKLAPGSQRRTTYW